MLRVVDETGATMADYTYDAWGSFTFTPGANAGANAGIIEKYNPVTYRGYHYDKDLEMYYLQSRYHNPRWGRFLNADICADTGESIVGTNMFVYCSNNPVMLIDPNGELAKFAQRFVRKVAGIFGFENKSDGWYNWFKTPWSTTTDCPQGHFGYCDFYDDAAYYALMDIDCLVSEFDFYYESWRIEFWKGRYGISIGAEIGLYNNPIDKRRFRSFYSCATDKEDWAQMSLTLYSSDNSYHLTEIFSVETGESGHWWLTGFLYNSFSRVFSGNPGNLVMMAGIYFKNEIMANRFIDALGERVADGFCDYVQAGNYVMITWAPQNHEYTIT